MEHRLHTTIDIEAPPEVVWEILTDLDAYSDWNPFIVSAKGEPEVGEQLINQLEPPGGKATTFKPTVTVAEPNHILEWLGHLGPPHIFDGRHRFSLDPRPNGTRLTHGEHFTGFLVPFKRRSLDRQTRQGFEAMNTALKTRAESRAEHQAEE